ncbi:glycosyltransferase family 4 protein [Ideonella sp.]|uniref:glycosyltransferase family 4 protein n=1 Tax=Ideonella sp. TaxID=1929293 RepID=UPI003BB5E8B8
MKIAILYNTSDYLLRFRSELIETLQKAGHEVIAITPRDDATPRLQALNVHWCEWQLEGQALNPLKDLAAILDLRRILSQERPDAVLNFTIKPVLYGSLVASWVGVPRIVSMITGMGSLFLPGSWKKLALLGMIKVVYRAAMRRNHRVLFQNDEDLAYFVAERFLAPAKSLRINGSGVNLARFPCQPGQAVAGSFLLISRMIREKGIHEFVAAARMVKADHPQASFVLVGPIDNNPGAITRQDIAAWEAEGIVRYAGVQADVRPFLAAAEVYVLPTYYLEGVPRSILEALSMGKPVITTDWRGCRDTVASSVNGYLVPPRDPEALADAMRQFLKDPTLSIQMGQASRALAKSKFDVEVVNDTVVQALVART